MAIPMIPRGDNVFRLTPNDAAHRHLDDDALDDSRQQGHRVQS